MWLVVLMQEILTSKIFNCVLVVFRTAYQRFMKYASVNASSPTGVSNFSVRHCTFVHYVNCTVTLSSMQIQFFKGHDSVIKTQTTKLLYDIE